MIKEVKPKYQTRIAEGETSIVELCAMYGLSVGVAASRRLWIEDEPMDPRFEVLLVHTGEHYIEFDFIDKATIETDYQKV